MTSAESLVEPSLLAIFTASSAVLTRFPLCAKAIVVPLSVAWMVGCAFSHVEPPVVE